MSPKIEAIDLKRLIAETRPGDVIYRHSLTRYGYTEGVKSVADAVGAYWLIDLIFLHLKSLIDTYGEDALYVFTLVVKNNAAIVYVAPSDDLKLKLQIVEYTDFPEGKWDFWFRHDVLYLPNEH
jgi:hypothetical protein